MSWLKEFPSLGSEQLSAVRRAVDGAFRSFTREHGETMERLFDPLREFLLVSERLLTQSPWPLVVGGIALIAWLASRSMKIVIGTVLTLLAIGYFGMWDDTMKTISMIFVCTVVAILIYLTRGRGVQLQSYRDGGLADAKVFTRKEGLSWLLGERTRTETDLRAWVGNRAGAGKAPPNGFPRSNRFE